MNNRIFPLWLNPAVGGTAQLGAGTARPLDTVGGGWLSEAYATAAYAPDGWNPVMVLPIGVEFALGSATGLLDCILFHWIDTLKVRRQDGRPLLMNVRTGLPLQRAAYRSLPGFALGCVSSLYAGFSTNLTLKVPYMAFMFAFNALNTRLLSDLGGDQVENGQGRVAKELAAAALVGVEVSLLLSPLEMVRIQGQNCGKGGLLSASRAVTATASGGGWLGAWQAWTRGMTATMHRESKYCAGQFFLCAKISEWVSQGGEESLGSQVVGAVLGGVACTVVSHPDDVIKTRMQTHLKGSPMNPTYATFAGSGMHVLRTEGLGALFNGAAFRCLLRVPLGLSVIIVSGSWMRARAERVYGTKATAERA